MTPDYQEKLFTSLRNAHPAWSVRRVSGYVHGANDESRLDQPMRDMQKRRDEYALGYLIGFAVRRGEDAEHEKWFRLVGRIKECRT